MIMDIVIIFIGLLMIGLGFLLKKSPDMIAGYNTMSRKKKKKVDIAGLSTFMRNALITIGISIIAGYYFFKLIGLPLIAECFLFVSIFFGFAFMLIKSRKYDQNKLTKTAKIVYVLIFIVFAFIIVFVVGSLISGTASTKIIVDDSTVEFKGMYGLKLDKEKIESVEIIDTIPKILMRTNGFGLGVHNKGHFNLQTFGKCRLFLESDTPAYIVITTKDDEKIIVNYKDSTKTRKKFDELNQLGKGNE